jgi:putative Mg2+ transporter-C (MgtC) family protein
MDSNALMGGLPEISLRLVAAVLVGCALGLNRELRDKPAGLRTHALVSLGSALVIVISLQLARSSGQLDGSGVLRVVQGIITGIGFLGGGVILHDYRSQNVTGLTTAASIWIAACLGIACGAGQWRVALIAVVLTLLVLVFGGPVERGIHRRFHDHKPVP